MLDGLVFARSAFHHSMNYRSVVLFGTGERISDAARKRAALDAIVEHIVPGRTREVRPTTDDEVASTLVLRLPLAEASVKVRTGGPLDEEGDHGLPGIWAGVVPVRPQFGRPIDDDGLPAGTPAPASATYYRRRSG